MTQVKLTKAQMELLRELPTHAVLEYKPAEALVSMGLAARDEVYPSVLDITAAGRELRAALKDRKP